MDDLDRLRDRLRRLPDDRLARMVGPERGLYSPEALVVADVEAEDRGLPALAGGVEGRAVAGPLAEEVEDAFDAGWDRTLDRVRGRLARRPARDSPPPPRPRDVDGERRRGRLRRRADVLWALSVALAALAGLALGVGVFGLATVGVGGLLAALHVAFYAGVPAALLWGGAEVVRLRLDVEGYARAVRRALPPPRPDGEDGPDV